MKNKKDVNKIEAIIKKINRNMRIGSYPPLPPDESRIIREHFANCIPLPIGGASAKILNAEGTIIGNGYTRIVIGDYGAYLEFDEDQIKLTNIIQRWAGKPTRDVKYIWMQTNDEENTKVYWQQDTVDYADYKVGMYYMDVLDAYTDDDEPNFIC
jgi:hypothetical protein